MVWHDMMWYIMNHMIWYNMTWYKYDMIRCEYDMTWYDMTCRPPTAYYKSRGYYINLGSNTALMQVLMAILDYRKFLKTEGCLRFTLDLNWNLGVAKEHSMYGIIMECIHIDPWNHPVPDWHGCQTWSVWDALIGGRCALGVLGRVALWGVERNACSFCCWWFLQVGRFGRWGVELGAWN